MSSKYHIEVMRGLTSLRKKSNRLSDRRAFTLVELIVVIVIVALMSGVVVYSVRGHVDAAALEGAVQRFQSLDHRLRAETKRHERTAEIRIGRRGGELTILTGIELSRSGIKRDFSVGSRVTIESILSARRISATRSITFNAAGRSANYAAKFVTENDATTWLVVLGISGQQIRCQSEEEVYALLRP